MVNREVLFEGTSDSDQLFKVFEVLGRGLSQSEIQYFKSMSCFPELDWSLLDEKCFHSVKPFESLFVCFKDKTNLVSLLRGMLKYNPEQRLTAEEALAHPFFNEVRSIYISRFPPKLI